MCGRGQMRFLCADHPPAPPFRTSKPWLLHALESVFGVALRAHAAPAAERVRAAPRHVADGDLGVALLTRPLRGNWYAELGHGRCADSASASASAPTLRGAVAYALCYAARCALAAALVALAEGRTIMAADACDGAYTAADHALLLDVAVAIHRDIFSDVGPDGQAAAVFTAAALFMCLHNATSWFRIEFMTAPGGLVCLI